MKHSNNGSENPKNSLLLSVIIPVYDEARTIIELLNKVLLVRIPKEIIIVDDSSKDGTTNLLNQFLKKFKPNEFNQKITLLSHTQNQGRSQSIMNGFIQASGEIIIPQDADLEYEPEDYYHIVECFQKGINAVYGSRFMKKNNRFFRHIQFYLGNRFLTFLFNVLFFWLNPNRTKPMTDIATCYKAVRREILKDILFPSMKRFEWCFYLTSELIKRGERIHEIPVSYSPRSLEEGKKIRWKDGWIAMKILIGSRLRKNFRSKQSIQTKNSENSNFIEPKRTFIKKTQTKPENNHFIITKIIT